MAFAIGFGIFLVLMAVLVAFVLRFAVQEGRRRRPGGGGRAIRRGHDGPAPRPSAGAPPESDPGSG